MKAAAAELRGYGPAKLCRRIASDARAKLLNRAHRPFPAGRSSRHRTDWGSDVDCVIQLGMIDLARRREMYRRVYEEH